MRLLFAHCFVRYNSHVTGGFGWRAVQDKRSEVRYPCPVFSWPGSAFRCLMKSAQRLEIQMFRWHLEQTRFLLLNWNCRDDLSELTQSFYVFTSCRPNDTMWFLWTGMVWKLSCIPAAPFTHKTRHQDRTSKITLTLWVPHCFPKLWPRVPAI